MNVDDPLWDVAGFNAREDRRHDRRTLALADLQRLIQAAHEGPTYMKMTGPRRALCYRLAVGTGLRYSEIASLTPEAFDLTGDHPTVTVEAGYTKNGDRATLPLPLDLAADLRPLLAALPPKTPVFPLPEKGAKMLRADLAAAGIPYRDASDLVFDFHSLRCQCATLADAAGVSPRVVQRLMRHSTLELTGRYTRPRALDLSGAAESLPALRPEAPGAEPMAATGTDGQHIGKDFGPYLVHTGDGSGRIPTDADGNMPKENPPIIRHKPFEMAGFDALGRVESASVVSTPQRIRTSNLRFRRPMLYPIELRVLFVVRALDPWHDSEKTPGTEDPSGKNWVRGV